MYLACHAPIMDNPENNQHFSVLILVGGRGVYELVLSVLLRKC